MWAKVMYLYFRLSINFSYVLIHIVFFLGWPWKTCFKMTLL
jgi:hypothetical protein